MRATTFAWAAALGSAAATTVPLNFYSDSECHTASTITPTAQGNVSECIVTPGMVSVHFGFVGCAGGGHAKPFFFKDTACGEEFDLIDGPFSTGNDGDCYTVYHTTVAAIMLSCQQEDDSGQTHLENPTATATLSVAPVATGATAAATTGAAATSTSGANSNNIGNNISSGWNSLGQGAHIGIYVGAAVVVLLILASCFFQQRRRRNDYRQRPPYPPPGPPVPPPPVPPGAPLPKVPDWSETEIPQEVSLPPYGQVLQNVVQAARYHAAARILDTDMPGGYGTGNPQDSVARRILDAAFPSSDVERWHKMGAAGELYMFEYLRGLNLPMFGRHNWTSEIRSLVNVHPEYRDLEDVFVPSAKSDIEYDDVQGVFTNFLISRGYLPEAMRGRARTYHFEVKATPSLKWDQPIPISNNQKNYIETDHFSQGHVYIICRLYGLGQGRNTHLHFYCNPVDLLARGRLFLDRDEERGGWRITPRL